jgi:hypothetical protein
LVVVLVVLTVLEQRRPDSFLADRVVWVREEE